MAMTRDETTRALRAARRYVDLCDAYRATSAAHDIVLGRIEAGLRRRAASMPPELLTERMGVVAERRLNARQTYATFVTRRLQALSRLDELGGG